MLTYKIGWLKIIVTGLEEWNMEIQRAVFDPDGIRIHFHGDSPAKLRFIAARPNGKFPNILNVPSSKEFFIRTRGTATRKGAKIEVSCELEKTKALSATTIRRISLFKFPANYYPYQKEAHSIKTV